MKTCVYIFFGLTFFVNLTCAEPCEPGNANKAFPILNQKTIEENAVLLCDFYNDNIGKRKQCVLNEAASRCERSSGPVELISFKDCMEMSPKILFSTVLKPDSYQENQACAKFDRQVSKRNSIAKETVGTSEVIELNQYNPLKVFILAPSKVNVELDRSTSPAVEYSIEAEDEKSLRLGLESFQAYYVPETRLLVISSGDGAKCGYSYAEENGVVTSDNLTGTCLKKVRLMLRSTVNVQVKSVSLVDLFMASAGLDSDLINFLEEVQTENIDLEETGIIDLTK